MPIKPENRKRYPTNWKQIRKDILLRANDKCEFCGIENKSFIVYEYSGSKIVDYDWVEPSDKERYESYKNEGKTWTEYENYRMRRFRKAMVVLTIAHLDHTPENCNYDNLRALCQKCHNSYDAKHRAETRKK